MSVSSISGLRYNLKVIAPGAQTERRGDAGPVRSLLGGKPHPRAYGTYPRILGRYVRELELINALEAGAMDYVMPDLQRIGGVSGWMRAAAITQAYGMDMSSHLFPVYSAHLLAVTPTAHWLEYMDWAAPIVAEPIQIKDGCALIPDRPGSGIAWNEDAVKRYAVA